MGTAQIYGTMDRSELEELKGKKLSELQAIHREIRKLKKKFKSGSYDRQVICEYIIGFQSQINSLIATIDGIDRALNRELSTAES